MRGRIIRGLALASCIAVLGTLFAPSVGVTQEPTRTDTVTVGAEREIDVDPDLVRMVFGVRTKGRSADGTLGKLATRSNAVLDALRDAGYSDDELTTQDVSLQRSCLRNCRDRDPRDGKRPEPVVGYRASSDIVVETAAIERVGETIDVAIDAGANRIQRVVFDVEDKREAVKSALRDAMAFATEKAQVLAESGNRELGPAMVIEEGRTRAPRPVGVAGAALEQSGGGGPSQAPPIEVEPPTLSASARVTVTFELR